MFTCTCAQFKNVKNFKDIIKGVGKDVENLETSRIGSRSKKKFHFRKHFVSSLKRKNWEDKLTQNIVDEFFTIAFLIIA